MALEQDHKKVLLDGVRSQYAELTGCGLVIHISEANVAKLNALAATGVLASMGEAIEPAIDGIGIG